jgi:uncharacterized protein (UPF0332 family)
MSFAWAEFNVFAQEIIAHPALNSGVEVVCRTAISRAYYAAFCTAHDFLVNVEHVYIDPTRDAHAQVAVGFQGRGDRPRRRVGAHLKTLRAQRNTADYDLISAQTMDGYTAQDCIDLADEILRILETL